MNRLRNRLPQKQVLTFMSRAYDEPDYELVGQFVIEVLELGVADFVSYDAPHEDPVEERPQWLGGDPTYTGAAREQTAEQIAWLCTNVARLNGADLRTDGSEEPYLHLGVADQVAIYVEVSDGFDRKIQALTTYNELHSRKTWDVSQAKGFRLLR